MRWRETNSLFYGIRNSAHSTCVSDRLKHRLCRPRHEPRHADLPDLRISDVVGIVADAVALQLQLLPPTAEPTRGAQPLEPTILSFQLLEALGIGNAHAPNLLRQR